MKSKLMAATIAAMCAMGAMFTGCTPNEGMIIAAANTAGNLGLSAWFAIDDPDPQVKANLKEVVSLVESGASGIGEGASYVEALAPAVQEFVSRLDGITSAQKNLINVGSMVMLGALDTFVEANPDIKGNAALASKVVAAFCRGCKTAIDRSDDCCTAKALKKAHMAAKLRYSEKAKAFVLPGPAK